MQFLSWYIYFNNIYRKFKLWMCTFICFWLLPPYNSRSFLLVCIDLEFVLFRRLNVRGNNKNDALTPQSLGQILVSDPSAELSLPSMTYSWEVLQRTIVETKFNSVTMNEVTSLMVLLAHSFVVFFFFFALKLNPEVYRHFRSLTLGQTSVGVRNRSWCSEHLRSRRIVKNTHCIDC